MNVIYHPENENADVLVPAAVYTMIQATLSLT